MEIYRWWLWLLLWIQNPRVHSSMVGAADCRSAGPWFNSGWRSWFIFMTGSDNLMNHPAQRYNTMSPTRTVITTITRKSVNIKMKKVKNVFFFKNVDFFQKLKNCKKTRALKHGKKHCKMKYGKTVFVKNCKNCLK